MKQQKLSKAALARRLGTSRTEIYRLLDPTNESVSIAMLGKAASAGGKDLALISLTLPNSTLTSTPHDAEVARY